MTIRAPYVTPQKTPPKSSSITFTTVSLALLVAATSLPFNNSASVTVPVPVKLSAPDQLHTNINNFTNPIPFGGSSGGKAFDLVGLVAPAQAYNPNLYSTVAASPFIPPQFGAALSLNSLPTPPRVIPYNPNLYATVAAAPFTPPQYGPTLSLNSLPTPPRVVPYNQLIYSEVPFSQTDWRTPSAYSPNPSQAQPYNALIYSEVPFVPRQFASSSSIGFNQPIPLYNINLYGVVPAAPFAQYDWSKPVATQLAVSQFAPTNINLFTNTVPFALYDWNKPSAYGPSKVALPTSSVALLTAVQAQPFIPVDYSKPYFPRNQIDATQAANPASFTNPQPFIPVDYNTTRQNPNFQIWAQGYNVNLFVPPVIVPPVDDGVRGSETILTDRRGAGGFSRKQYDEFVKAKRAALARKLKKKPAAEVRLAVELAEQAVLKAGLLGSFAPSIEPLIGALQDADTVATAQEAARVAEMLLAQMEDDDEDDIMILLSTL